MAIMNMTNSNANATISKMTSVEEYRQDLSDQTALILLPAIILISILMIMGTIGNSVVLYVYLKKFNPTSTRTAILALAVFDLIASLVAMPGEIVDIRYSYNFENVILCKCFRFGTMVALVASGLTLLVVAVDRYRRICHPLKDQLTPGQTKKWTLVSLMVALVFATPSPVMYGLAKVEIPVAGVYGVECSIDFHYKNTFMPLIYNIAQTLLFTTVFVSMIVLYSLLGRTALRQNKYRNSMVKRTLSQEDRDHSITDGTGHKDAGSPVSNVMPSIDISDRKEKEIEQKTSKSSPRKMSIFRGNHRKSSNGDIKTRKTTFMLFIITLVFVISFLPHLILKGFQATRKNFPNKNSDTELVIYNIFVRSYFFNSVSNCIIYGFCSPKFRRECKKLALTLFCCLKSK